MLYLLTGDIQTGKTRWLIRLVGALEGRGVRVEGVVAPGIWRNGPDGGFEKLGIENVLLPGNERVTFAMRGDLVAGNEARRPDDADDGERSHSGWVFSDEAIEAVNRHFAQLREERCALADADEEPTPRLLVVDELGWLELERGEGLTEAVALLGEGPRHARDDALVVVRAVLADRAEELLSPAWGPVTRLHPDEAARTRLLSALS